MHTCVCGNERSVGMREEKRPRSYGSAPATRLFPSLHHLSSLSLSPRRASFLPLGRQFRERKTQEGEGGGDRLENESRRDAERRRNSAGRGEGDARKGDLRGGVKRSERWIFGNEVTWQRSRSRLRVTGRLIDVNRLGDESAITFLSTRVSLERRDPRRRRRPRWKLERRKRNGSRGAPRRQNSEQLQYRGNARPTSRYLLFFSFRSFCFFRVARDDDSKFDRSTIER